MTDERAAGQSSSILAIACFVCFVYLFLWRVFVLFKLFFFVSFEFSKKDGGEKIFSSFFGFLQIFLCA